MAELPQFIPEDWENYFDDTTVERGRQVWRAGKVLNCSLNEAKAEINARVRGSSGERYNVTVFRDGPELIQGECSCPMEYNCKHVVAAILEAISKSESSKITPIPRTPKPATPPKPKIGQELQSWLNQLQQAATFAAPDAEKPIGEATERIAYVLTLQKMNQGRAKSPLTINVQKVVKLAQGGFGAGENLSVDYVLNNRPACARAEDIHLLKRLKMMQTNTFLYGNETLNGEEGAALLADILKTGRCHWRGTGKKHPPLSLGQPRLAKLEWTADAQGMQSTGLDVTPKAFVILPLTPPWYFDEASGACGPLDTGLPPAVAEAWINAPVLTPDQAELLNEELSRRFPDLHIPPPRRIEIETIVDIKPVPCLRLFSIKASQQNYGYYYGRSRGLDTIDLNLARVEFDYEGARVASGQPGTMIENFHDGKLRRILRDLKFEKRAYLLLLEIGFCEAREQFFNYGLGKQADALTLEDSNAWFDFCHSVVPQMRADRWRVEMDESFGFRIAEPEHWYADASESSGIDWFGVEVGVQLSGQKLNLLPILLAQLQRNPRLLAEEALASVGENAVIPIPLPDGRILAFPFKRAKEMLGVLLELFGAEALDRGGKLRLSKLRAAELSKIAGGADWRWMGGDELRDLGRRLHDFKGIKPIEPSQNFRAVLRGYQQEGLNWLQFLREYGLAGILADDMGLGKTVQALAHLVHEKESGRADLPSLIVAPTSLMTNWRQETERFAPGLKVLVLHGSDRKQHFEKLREHDLVVTSYPLLPRDQAVLKEQDFHCVILDEAQFIKNPKTQYAQIVCQLKARQRLCLTGTPMENHLGELWSLFNFLLPGFLGDETRFRKVFRLPIEKGNSDERRTLLARRVAPFLLRRRKDEVVKELPPKTEIVQNVELAGAQRDLYETIRLAMHTRVREEIGKKGLSRSHIIILDALLKLRQVCCDPRLLKLESAKRVEESAKLQLLMDLLPEMVAEGRRILLFSQFTSMLALIEPELAKAKIPHVLLTGQTTDRATPIQRFQQGEVPLFLISLKAGGTGLNLTAADTVIHYDPWWNPAVENQATDRAHRIGQEKHVFVYKLMTVGTVEEKILELQKRKKELVEGLLDENCKESLKLSSEDLDVLFAPIG